MNYVGPEMETICIGSAYGTAAMLLANGAKGKRSCLPNSTIMLSQPRSQARGQASDIRIKAREVLTARNTISQILSEKTGQSIDKVTDPPARAFSAASRSTRWADGEGGGGSKGAAADGCHTRFFPRVCAALHFSFMK